MGTPEETFQKGVAYRLEGNECFKKQEYKQGNHCCQTGIPLFGD